MEHLYLFNPENDLALASSLEHYTPKPLAMQLHRDLQMLPAWWAEDGAFILSQCIDDDKRWCQHLHDNFGINIGVIDENRLQNHTFQYHLWGWNLSTRSQLLALKVPANQLPTPLSISKWRELSHRRVTIAIHRRISQLLGSEFSPIPQEFTSLDQITRFADQHYRCFLKAPWSSSGKGIFRPTETDNLTYIYWVNGILQRQGSVIAEIPLDKTVDFAMEFMCHDGKASFAGYSVFTNDAHNSFDSGIVASEQRLRSILDANLSADANRIDDIRQALETVLTEIVAPHYSGYLGIDMLIYRDEMGENRINPCVEMNLRTTMGVVTSIIGNRFIHPQSIGHFHVEYHKAPVDVAEYMAKKVDEHPAVFHSIDGRRLIKKGTILLAPIYSDSRYCVYLDIDDAQ